MGGPAAEGWEAGAGLERSVLAGLTAADGGGEAAVQVLLDALVAAQHRWRRGKTRFAWTVGCKGALRPANGNMWS